MQVNGVLDRDLARSIRAIRRVMWREMLLGTIGRLGALDLSFTQVATLLFLEAEREASVTDVAAVLDRSLATTSRLLDGLVQRDLILREEDPDDRRVKRLRLSEAGLHLLVSIERERVDAQLAAMELLTPEERALVVQATHLLAEAISRRFQDAH